MAYFSKGRERRNTDYATQMKLFVLQGVIPTGETLGRGAYGNVLQVEYCGVNYVGKEVHSILVEHGEFESLKDQFLRMAYLLSRCRHPNIVQFIGIYYADPIKRIPTIVMEKMDMSLRKLIEENAVPLNSLLSVLHDVSVGVWYLHTRKPPIIHCDLTPNNILVNVSSMVAKIAGFGTASEGSTGDVRVPGTPDFMPPEALVERPLYSLPLDIFGYGGVSLYAVVGEWPAPLQAVRSDRRIVALSEVERRQQYLDKMIGEAEMLRPLVEECLDNDPERRPTIEIVSERIKEMREIYMDHHPETKVILVITNNILQLLYNTTSTCVCLSVCVCVHACVYLKHCCHYHSEN